MNINKVSKFVLFSFACDRRTGHWRRGVVGFSLLTFLLDSFFFFDRFLSLIAPFSLWLLIVGTLLFSFSPIERLCIWSVIASSIPDGPTPSVQSLFLFFPIYLMRFHTLTDTGLYSTLLRSVSFSFTHGRS